MAPSPRRWFAAAALVAACVVTVSGCGTPRVDPSAGASASDPASDIIPEMPSANDFVSAIMFTKSAGAADLDVEAVTSVGGSERRLRGTGPAAVGQGYADLTWTSDAGTMRELVNDQGIFVQTDVPDGKWNRLGEGARTPTTGFADPIRGLAAMSDVAEEGAETVEGLPATRYSGTIPVDPAELSALGLSDEEITSLGEAWKGAVVDATVWLDGSNRVIRVERTLDLGDASPVPASTFVVTTISDYGKVISLRTPPDESLIDAPETQ